MKDKDKTVLFEAKQVSLAYGKRRILAEVNLTIHQGDFWFLLGPNGQGKTTFLKALLGVLPIQAGQMIFSSVVSGRKAIGFVPQRCDLNPTLPTTVREFVLMGLVGQTLSKKEEALRLDWALEKVGLKNFSAQDYWALSGGQRQRALVARALVRRPQLLIADEPTNGLDLASEQNLLHGLEKLNQTEKLTVLFVTHQIALAYRYATHAAIFHEGTVQAGLSEDILNDRKLSGLYDMSMEDFHASFGTARR